VVKRGWRNPGKSQQGGEKSDSQTTYVIEFPKMVRLKAHLPRPGGNGAREVGTKQDPFLVYATLRRCNG